MGTRQITKETEIQEILGKTEYCNLSMVDEKNEPYVLPFNFGFDNQYIYLHSASTGKKIDILKKNPAVCLSFSCDHELFFRHEHVACSYNMKFRSLLVYGQVIFIDDFNDKIDCMNMIMKKYTGKEFKYNDPAIKNVMTFKVKIEKITGKANGY